MPALSHVDGRVRRSFLLVIVNLLVFVVLAEVAAVVLYFAETGAFYYTYRPAHRPIPETAEGQISADGLHPYFGPIHRPGVRDVSNNVGFTSPYDVPFTKSTPDDFIVGIFGGSVGEWFCQLGVERMVERLSRHPFFDGRRIVPLCFSHEGYKQPQQALVLAYFLTIGQTFDLVVNIDGFNEVALATFGHERGWDISMPSPPHLQPLIDLAAASTLTPEKLESLARIDRYKRRLNTVAGALRTMPLASAGVAMDHYYRWTRGRYLAELARFAALPPTPGAASVIEVTPPVQPRDRERLYEDIAAAWTNASLLMHDLLAARSVPYLHVLQPNQYFGPRRFSAEEARVAINDSSPFRPPVEQGYPVLRRASARLEATGQFFDATRLFDEEPAAVYMDDCCHYTELGNQLLADAIAARVLAGDGPWRTPRVR